MRIVGVHVGIEVCFARQGLNIDFLIDLMWGLSHGQKYHEFTR
jgi:hypothetical protein